MPVLTFFPDAHPESTTIDGETSRFASPAEDWATIIAGAGNGTANSTPTMDVLAQASDQTDKWIQIFRTIVLFDTSALAGATILSASLNLKVYSKQIDVPSSIVPVESNPASNVAISSSDHLSFGSTALANPVAISAMASVNSYQSFPLNSNGIAAINLTGISKFGLVLEQDRAASSPIWSANALSGATFYSADQAGTSSDPYLSVAYTAPGVTPRYAIGGTFTRQANIGTFSRII